jgi:hypothetical protein
MHADHRAGAPFDFPRRGVVGCQAAALIGAPAPRPVDDGGASLDERTAIEQDRQRRRLRAVDLGQDEMQARRPADLLIVEPVPVERPACLLAKCDAAKVMSFGLGSGM